MNIEQIPSDKIVVMTDFLHRAFNAGGCNPMCHSCFSRIKVGENFHLATVDKYSPNTSEYGKIANRKDAEVVKAINGQEFDKENVTVKSSEVMLCEKCDVISFSESQLKRYENGAKSYEEYKKFTGGGCFRINGKIVI
jgi:hypothetical protein